VLAPRGTDVVQTEHGKSLRNGLYELRIRWSAAEIAQKAGDPPPEYLGAPEKILLRVHFCTDGPKRILLLSGFDKGQHPKKRYQDGEIAKARKMIAAHAEAKRAQQRATSSAGSPTSDTLKRIGRRPGRRR
jgi:hypothetical protein